MLRGLWLGNNTFNPALKNAALKKNPVVTFKAFNSDIGAKPDYLPFIAATGVLLLEADNITELYLQAYSSYDARLDSC